jgi:peptidoglycan-associated lipoprotein
MFLISHGAPLDRITVEAVGDSEPIDPGNNPVAWAKNRRVQVLWR